MDDRDAAQTRSMGGNFRRVRDRILALLTANVAMGFALAGWYEAERVVLPVNSGRVLEIQMLRSEARLVGGSRNSSTSSDSDDPKLTRAQKIEDIKNQIDSLQNQMGVTFVIGYAWKYMMYLMAVLLEALAIVAVLLEHRRWPQLTAGLLILISTTLTLVGMSLLMNPDYGGMERLQTQSYVYAGLIQGGYGVILLIAALWPSGRQQRV
jgi:hypothetical protein